jgi:predicted esterase
MTREERGAEIEDTVRYLDRLWERVRAQGALAPDAALRALGFSQGGAAAARWAVLGHAAVEHVCLWGCPLPPDLDLAGHAERARGLRWTLVLGDADHAIDRSAWEAGVARLRAASIEPQCLRFPGGHELEAATLEVLGRERG